jgi:hypothetical protein
MMCEVYKKMVQRREELLDRILGAAVCNKKRNVKANSDQQHAILAQDLKSALGVPVGVFNRLL